MNTYKLDNNEMIDDVVSKVNTMLIDAVGIPLRKKTTKRHIKRKKLKKNSKPWFTDDLVVLKNRLRKAGMQFVNNVRDDALRQQFFKLKRKFKMEVKSRKRKFKQCV